MPPSINFELCCLKRKLKQKEEQFIHSQRGAINRVIIKHAPKFYHNKESLQVEQNVFEDNTIHFDNFQSNETIYGELNTEC